MADTTCPYCGLHDHTGREHMQFVMSLSDGPSDPAAVVTPSRTDRQPPASSSDAKGGSRSSRSAWSRSTSPSALMSDTGCPYCGLRDHTGREHFQFAMALSDDKPHVDPCDYCPHDNTEHAEDGCRLCPCAVPQ